MVASQRLLLVLSTVLYIAHALLRLWRMFRAGRPSGLERHGLLFAALALHSVFLLSRGVQAGGLPVETRQDSLALFLWATAAVFLTAGWAYHLEGADPLFWCIFAAAGAGMWALGGGDPAPRESLARVWLILHLVPVYAGYAGFAAAAALGLAYLVQERMLRRRPAWALWRKLPSLEALERAGRVALSLGFPVLTVGLAAGAIWAEQSSALLGRAWYADQKVVGGLVVWLFYAGVLHVRLFARMRGRQAALLTLGGFTLTLASFATVHVYSSARAESRPAATPSGEVQAGKP